MGRERRRVRVRLSLLYLLIARFALALLVSTFPQSALNALWFEAIEDREKIEQHALPPLRCIPIIDYRGWLVYSYITRFQGRYDPPRWLGVRRVDS